MWRGIGWKPRKKPALFKIAVSCIITVSILFMARLGLTSDKKYEKAAFAGGCFWCMEPVFKTMDGVIDVVAGYTGGTRENPTYEEVSSGRTGHVEAVQVTYDPSKTDYSEILDVF